MPDAAFRFASALEAIAARIWWHGFAWGAASTLLTALAVAVVIILAREKR